MNKIQIIWQTAVSTSCQTGRRVIFTPQSYITNGGELVTMADGMKEYAVADHLGSTRATIDQSGRIQHFNYKPFGDSLNSGSVSRIGFIGGPQDNESRYFSLGARMYDPEIGRFLSPDPLLEMFPQHSSYHYAYNSPLIWKDPSGLKGEKEKGDKMLETITMLEIDEAGELWFITYEMGQADPLNPGKWKPISKRSARLGGMEGGSGNSNGGIGTKKNNDIGSEAGGGGGSSTSSKEFGLRMGERIIWNWDNLNSTQHQEIGNAIVNIVQLDSKYENRIVKYLKSGFGFNLYSKNGTFLAFGYKLLMCIDDPNRKLTFLPGLTVRPPNQNKGNCHATLNESGLEYGIFFANEFFVDLPNEEFSSDLSGYQDQLGEKIKQADFIEFWMVFAHEFAHEYNNKFFIGPPNSDGTQEERKNDDWVKELINAYYTRRKK